MVNHTQLTFAVVCFALYNYTFSLSVPPPNVSVTLNTDVDEVYQGTELVLTCSVSVNTSVNTPFTVNISWSSDSSHDVLNGQYVIISNQEGSGYLYSRKVTISPVNTSDSANYICSATVFPSDSTFIIASNTSKDEVIIEVKGRLCLSICRSVQPSMLSLCCSLILSHTLICSLAHALIL